jgi:hypothetical protein
MTRPRPAARYPDPPQLSLPPERHERIFQQEIVPDLLGGVESSRRAVLQLLAGQPGAGSARTMAALAAQYDTRGGAASLDLTALAGYHPQLAALLRRDSRTAFALIATDVRRWMTKLLACARGRHINVVLEATVTDPPHTASQARAFLDAGYRVEMSFLAVPAVRSRLGNLLRQQPATVVPLVSRAAHDREFRSVLDLANAADRGNWANAVHVFGYGGAHLRTTRRGKAGQWTQPPRSAATIERERQRRFTPGEAAAFFQTAAELSTRVQGERAGELASIIADAAGHAPAVSLGFPAAAPGRDETPRASAPPRPPSQRGPRRTL